MKTKIFKYDYLTDFFSRGHERTLRAKKNITISFITKISSLVISFLIVPLTLNYVGKVEYGIWMAISAIINWFAFFDIGLGNGLRNKLSEALALNDDHLAKIYISSVFAIIGAIAIIMFLIFFIAANFISWNAALHTDIVTNDDLFKIVTMVFFFFCVGFVFKLISSVLAALQRYAINDILGLTAQIFGLVAIYILVKNTNGSLFYLCLVYGSKSAIVMMIASLVLFSGSLKKYRPSLKYIQLKEATPLINLGFKFFANQIFYLITTQASVLLVIQLFGPEDVTVFNLAVRYITIASMSYLMVLTPFLTAFTEAYTKQEYEWIKSTIKKINFIWILVSIGTVILVIIYKWFFNFWVGDEVSVPLTLIFSLGVASIIGMWGATFTLFLNGVGKIKLQLYVLGAQAIIFIPLSYIFYKLNFGLSSIVLAQIILYISNAIIFTVQYNKIVNQTAVGIWDK